MSLHHDFNQSTATEISAMVQGIDTYLRKVCGSILAQDVTGEILTEVNMDMLLCCIKEGTDAFAKFIKDRSRSMTTSIYPFNH
jgi:hypothetical protein